MHYLIIGSGPSGVIAAETLRKEDQNAQITLVGDEHHTPYSRMAIPYFLAGEVVEHGTHLRKNNNHFDEQQIKLVRGRVKSLLPEQKQVSLENGESITYDKLLIATGCQPILPKIPGVNHERVVTCWTLDDARRIAAHAKPGQRVILIGAGFIGCIILKALVSCDVQVSVIENCNRMVPRMMNEKAGIMIRDWCIDKGVSVHTDSKVTQISEPKTNSRSVLDIIKGFFGQAEQKPSDELFVTLDNDTELSGDLVICATGVRSNVDFLQGSGIEVEHGILVNEFLQTNLPDIYASGDVAQALDVSTGERMVQAIQPTAVEHGRLVALNMLGNAVAHKGSISMNMLDTMGLISSSFGLWMGTENGEQTEFYDQEGYRYLNLQFDGDLLVGATCIGLTSHVGALRGLIQSKIPLGDWKAKLLENPLQIPQAFIMQNKYLIAKCK